MVYLVPFDGSDLSRTALDRAVEFAEHTGEEVVVLTVLPDDEEYARMHGWIEDGEYDPETVADRQAEAVREIAPEATYRWEVPAEVSSMASTTMDVVRTIREVAHELDATIVFIGSENAGRVSAPVTSVGSPVSEDPQYDVFIVRHARVDR